ncbi:flavin reductase family protein [Roseomonas sp. OT10]|uniref:flavin reductase family protein n=1 Tax=Roseomonas cutis TaxID=2897332 RepID=UPI001E602D0F|nr:flavin reductase family protein [Roseomonas sp. OT10]UFN46945.1 flavin reductase family protein [Roseomonas sp. OT10]
MTETTPPETQGFDFAALTPRERYKLMIGTIIPRPIAWVTTRDAQGRANAGPYSFFNCLSADPPIVALGVEYRADGSQKDTSRNIRDTGCFTVNIVSNALVEAMNVTAVPFPAGVDELAEAGLEMRPGTAIDSPRIAGAVASLECRLDSFLPLRNSRDIILGEIVYVHVVAGAVNESLHVDPALIDAVGRLGGHGYSTIRDRFDLPTMSVEAYRDGRIPGRTPG